MNDLQDAVLFIAGNGQAVSRWDVVDASNSNRPRWTLPLKCKASFARWTQHAILVATKCAPEGDHEMHAVRPDDGKLLWSRRLGVSSSHLPMLITPVVADERGLAWWHDYLASEIDVETGRDRWTWASPGVITSMLRVSDTDWLVSSIDSGTERIRVDKASHPRPIRLSGRVRVVGFPNQKGITVHVSGGWSTTTAADGTFALEIPARGRHVVTIDAPQNDARVAALLTKARAAVPRPLPPRRKLEFYYLSFLGWQRTIDTEVETTEPTEGLDVVITSTLNYNPGF